MSFEPHTVYELFDINGSPLYVGCTRRLSDRLRDHRRTKPWWSDVAFIATQTRGDGLSGHALERERIRTLLPAHNLVSNPAAVDFDRGSVASYRANRGIVVRPAVEVIAEAMQSGGSAADVLAALKAHGYKVARRNKSDADWDALAGAA